MSNKSPESGLPFLSWSREHLSGNVARPRCSVPLDRVGLGDGLGEHRGRTPVDQQGARGLEVAV